MTNHYNYKHNPVVEGDATGGVIPYKNVPALISYYLGIFSIIPIIGILMGIAAVILGVIGLSKYKENPVIKGVVHAWVGIVCGAIFGGLWVVLFVVVGFMA